MAVLHASTQRSLFYDEQTLIRTGVDVSSATKSNLHVNAVYVLEEYAKVILKDLPIRPMSRSYVFQRTPPASKVKIVM